MQRFCGGEESSRSNRSAAGGQIQTARQKTNLEVLAARGRWQKPSRRRAIFPCSSQAHFLGRRVFLVVLAADAIANAIANMPPPSIGRLALAGAARNLGVCYP